MILKNIYLRASIVVLILGFSVHGQPTNLATKPASPEKFLHAIDEAATPNFEHPLLQNSSAHEEPAPQSHQRATAPRTKKDANQAETHFLQAPALQSSSVSYSISTKEITLKIAHGQMVSVSAFLLTGQKIERLSSKRYINAGTHTFSLAHMQEKASVVILNITGADFKTSQRIDFTH